MTEQMTGYRVSFVELFAPRDGSEEGAPAIVEIEIPVIQRDYAQGRDLESVSEIRTSFLGALRHALAGGERISLDFVYGDVDNGVFRPLDGQQRLTTLYLLHWYIGQRAGRDLTSEPWTQFSYATRPSSRRFLEELACVCLPTDRSGRLSEWITDQPWFHYGWEQDPTIRSMLVMLDAIELTFGDLDPVEVWDSLTSPDSPVVSFYVLPIEEMGQGDALYIKMNSRGKPLTPFENFKALFERAVAHTAHGDEIAHKIDSVWSDVMWPYRGDDDIVDDEFLKYFTFLIEVGEWRAKLAGEGRLIDRAERLLGGESETQQRDLDFFVAALDTWVGVDVSAYFEGILREPGATRTDGDDRPVLFVPDSLSGVNLFALACRHYGEMKNHRVRSFPLTLTVLLYAVLVHRLSSTPDFNVRLRVLRNLVEASENEIRADRMHRILMDVDHYLQSEDGDLRLLKSFNQVQLEDEVRKRTFLAEHPAARDAVQALEDHRLLRGSLGAFDLDADLLAERGRAFERMFAEPATWPALTGALLTKGDYFRQASTLSYYFGSPTTEGPWRQLLTGGGKGSVVGIRSAWAEMLDGVSRTSDSLDSLYADLTSTWLADRRSHSWFDWRYHLVAYDEMREGRSGIYVTERGVLDFELCALRRVQLNSKYRDPYLYAIYRRGGVEESLQDPWFSGYQYHPRWLRVTGSELALRSRNHGFDIQCLGQEAQVAQALDGIAGSVTVADGHVTWWAPQHDDSDTVVDTVDRVEVGCEIVRRLVALAEMPLP